ncbi:hypothetical protein PoB_000108500 [Plakobranchus ocellatus]|uniref:Uncharacterized protein n=1 Tax=Plakobranchus ocellatus TaxID=259542 RepID=A0AAV3XVE2_9GAST|nr:hypothetical protein PoB_000108500 [Plakobranchus ocellatus]
MAILLLISPVRLPSDVIRHSANNQDVASLPGANGEAKGERDKAKGGGGEGGRRKAVKDSRGLKKELRNHRGSRVKDEGGEE